jgi:hypothetical protein
MMRRLLERRDIDAHQWRVLTRTLLKLDFRVGGFGGRAFGGHREGAQTNQILLTAILYLFVGIGSAAAAVWVRDPFTGALVVVTGLMVLLGSILLVDYQSVITSPDDYRILGFQPISSRTYFAVRLTNVLIYAAIPTTAIAVPATLAYGVARGFNPVLGAAALAGVYGAGLLTTLGVIVLYAGLLRVVSAERLQRALSYFQVLLGFLIYGAVPLSTSLIDAEVIGRLTVAKSPWLLLHPASWFASYLDIAQGHPGAADVARALLSVAALAALARAVSGRLSMEYSERLGAMLATTATGRARVPSAPGRSKWIGWLFPAGEARATAVLIRAQFRHDQKFRLAILGIVPVTALYVLLSVRRGMNDPFVAASTARVVSALPIIMMLSPVMLKATLARSDAYRASWLFYASPANHARIVQASKRFVLLYFTIPYFALIGAVLSYIFGHPGHAAVHTLMLGLLGYLFLQIAVLIDPDLPFSQPMRKGDRSALLIGLMLFLTFAAAATSFVLTRWVYPSAVVTGLTMASLAALCLAIDPLIVQHVRRLSERWEYIE